MIINNSEIIVRGYLDKQTIDLNNKVIKFVINTNEVTKVELLLWKDVRNTDNFEMIKKYLGLGAKARLEFRGKLGVNTFERDGEIKYYNDIFVNSIMLLGTDEKTDTPQWAFE